MTKAYQFSENVLFLLEMLEQLNYVTDSSSLETENINKINNK
jgi:hypothetical protein